MRSDFDETSEAIYLTSGYVFATAEEAEQAFLGENDHYVYSRYTNPTVSMFEERLRSLEGAEACYATGSGMAAVFTALASLLGAGDRIVASRQLFGACYVIIDEILPRWGVESVFVDGTDLDAWRAALATPASAVFFETPSNPMLELRRRRRGLRARQGGRRLRRGRQRLRHARSSPVRSTSAPTSSSTPRPSTSTGRAARWPARSSASTTSSTDPSATSCATSGPRCRPSTPG